MREANSVVGHLQVLVEVQLTAGPDAAIAVLVGGEILDYGLHLSAVRVSGIGKGNIPADGELAIGPGGAVTHEGVKVRMGDVALELTELGATRPGDRKSTRLNSSHLVISYAVFCLKKKIKKTEYRNT